MATNYTTKTAALKATKADMRQVQVSKKIEIGSTDTKTIIEDGSVSAEDLLVSVEGKDERQSVKTLIKDVSDKVDNMKMGIDIGTKDDSFDNDDDTAGFLKSVSKLNFKGAFVNVIKKDDGTVDLWINPDNNLGKIDAASSSFTAPTGSTSKYVFGGDDYTLPANSGASFARCHAVANDPTVTLKGFTIFLSEPWMTNLLSF